MIANCVWPKNRAFALILELQTMELIRWRSSRITISSCFNNWLAVTRADGRFQYRVRASRWYSELVHFEWGDINNWYRRLICERELRLAVWIVHLMRSRKRIGSRAAPSTTAKVIFDIFVRSGYAGASSEVKFYLITVNWMEKEPRGEKNWANREIWFIKSATPAE